MKNYSAFDIIGPKMVGPSSSHTAGANRLGRVARKIANDDIKSVKFLLHGSFAKTYKGHGTDRALVAGIMGMMENDEELKNSLEIANKQRIKYEFVETNLGEVHPNTVKFIIEKSNGEQVEIMGASIGGGNIKITEISGLRLEFTGQYPTVITRHKDYPGVIAKVTKMLADYDINIAFMSVYRQDKGQDAFMVIESDHEFKDDLGIDIKREVDDVKDVYIIESM
ncbi:L-serine ammonia-lyase, iron-sulfur-dependent subunit beta [Crassaminicella profunda]|uniref:L-serine ammonia-lyase, iron-sulfur-dependent subunit beta n=1 Tax=Crassaminicella profunda TaxID=1286698 RepID=UPI001CA6EADD|nr:L-serine ammonia-lyase, iron-sulfur-dependent subunit beta [Crassaminicella profunda]QZY54018.1 L-serine ammonia-lyase, iron-sulfur-dependent subunit beta [Crassaminicella profunda]